MNKPDDPNHEHQKNMGERRKAMLHPKFFRDQLNAARSGKGALGGMGPQIAPMVFGDATLTQLDLIEHKLDHILELLSKGKK